MTILATIDDHLAYADGLAKAAVPLGFFVAFCVQNRLCSDALLQAHPSLAQRVRYREGRVSEFFVAACGGQLSAKDLTPQGEVFVAHYLPLFQADMVRVFGEDIYAVKDNWENYQRIAQVMTEQLLGPKSAGLSLKMGRPSLGRGSPGRWLAGLRDLFSGKR